MSDEMRERRRVRLSRRIRTMREKLGMGRLTRRQMYLFVERLNVPHGITDRELRTLVMWHEREETRHA